jgi:hypothetical protein
LSHTRCFSSSSGAARCAGIDITVYASGDKRSKGQLLRQGPPLLRWALHEAAMAASPKGSPDHAHYQDVEARRQGDSDGKVPPAPSSRCRRSLYWSALPRPRPRSDGGDLEDGF